MLKLLKDNGPLNLGVARKHTNLAEDFMINMHRYEPIRYPNQQKGLLEMTKICKSYIESRYNQNESRLSPFLLIGKISDADSNTLTQVIRSDLTQDWAQQYGYPTNEKRIRQTKLEPASKSKFTNHLNDILTNQSFSDELIQQKLQSLYNQIWYDHWEITAKYMKKLYQSSGNFDRTFGHDWTQVHEQELNQEIESYLDNNDNFQTIESFKIIYLEFVDEIRKKYNIENYILKAQ